MPPAKDIVIIGGGAIGCSIAYHLAKQGIPSHIVEMDSVASQASGRAWAVISAPARLLLFFEGGAVPRGFMRPCLSLFEEGLRRFPHLAPQLKEEGGIDIEWGDLPCLSLIFAEAEEKRLKKRMAELASEGFITEWLDSKEVKARVPGINPKVRGAVYFPGQQVEPYKYVLSMFQAAERQGASITQVRAVGFRRRGSRISAVVLADGSEVKGDAFVIAMGPWSGVGLSWLGKELPMLVRREQCLKVEVPKKLPAYRLLSSTAAIIPKVNGMVILGLAGKHDLVHEEVTDFNDTPTQEAKEAILKGTTNLLPEMEDSGLVEHRAGLEGWQPEGGLPTLGRVPDFDNLYLSAWLATWGIQYSPAVGRIMAGIIIKGRMPETLEPLNPARFIKNVVKKK